MVVLKKVTMDLEHGVSIPWEKLDDWQRGANQYTATLKYGGRQMTVPFFTGKGWDREPTWKDVLSSCINDYYSVENARDFEEFCEELGYDPDSRKAERIYNECDKMARKLIRLFNDDEEEITEFARILNKEGY
jgi:hypothetical protein